MSDDDDRLEPLDVTPGADRGGHVRRLPASVVVDSHIHREAS